MTKGAGLARVCIGLLLLASVAAMHVLTINRIERTDLQVTEHYGRVFEQLRDLVRRIELPDGDDAAVLPEAVRLLEKHQRGREALRKTIAGDRTLILLLLPCTVIGVVIAGRLIYRGRRILRGFASDTSRGITSDASKRVVLFLRSFELDGTGGAAGWERRPTRWGAGMFALSMEEELAEAISEVGRCVTLKDPRDPVPELGFKKYPADPSSWRENVMALAHRAALVIIRSGSSPSLRWEIREVFRTIPLERIVVVLPHRYQDVEREASERLAVLQDLRELSGLGIYDPGTSSILLYFRRGAPRFASASRRSLRERIVHLGLGNRMRGPLKEVLVGLGWPGTVLPPLSRRERTLSMLAVFGFSLLTFGELWNSYAILRQPPLTPLINSARAELENAKATMRDSQREQVDP